MKDFKCICDNLTNFISKKHQVQWDQVRVRIDHQHIAWLRSTLRYLNRWIHLARSYSKGHDMESALLAMLSLGWQGIDNAPDNPTAVINVVVAHCKTMKPKAWRMCLALLWRYARSRQKVLHQFSGAAHLRYACPKTLVDHVRSDYPNDWRQILKAWLDELPISLRLKNDVDVSKYIQSCHDLNIDVDMAQVAQAVTLQKRAYIPNLPGYNDGVFWVQDIGAQLLGCFLREEQSRLLDIGAAPGGKTFIALSQGYDVTSIDSDKDRMIRMQENLLRLNWSREHCFVCDVFDWQDWNYDVIVIDVPCTASGVMAKHPEAKWCYKHEQISQLKQVQTSMLAHVMQYAKPGTRVVYSTCSIFHSENDEVIGSCWQDKWQRVTIEHPMLTETQYGYQVVPSTRSGGYYYACFDLPSNESRT